MPAAAFPLRRGLAIGAGVAFLALVALGVLALPFRGVQADADTAESELTLARGALDTGDIDAATAHVARARVAVDELRDTTEGIGGRVWSLVPVAGPGVRDVRRLGTALHEVTSAAEVATRVYPELAGAGATLFRDGGVDLAALTRLTGAARDVEGHLRVARDSLDSVDGDAPVVGGPTAAARDRALDALRPVQGAVHELRPLLDALPSILGADGAHTYLVAMLNPAEMRFSGGATLAFATVTLDEGRLVLGETNDTANANRAFRPVNWEPVDGNPFHGPYRQRITNANLAPSWPVSGEELLRAWTRVKHDDVDGLVAVDVVALARLLEVTGPLVVPGSGEVGADRLVELTVGSYDRFGPGETQRRKALNRRLVPAFAEKLFGGVDAPGTFRALADSARARHLAVYLRDPAAQRAMADLRADGDLSTSDGDYLGLFTQNLGGTKSDYWQRKVIASDVRLAADGSARVKLDVEIRNEAPPGHASDIDNYTRRSLDLAVGAFLPRGADVRRLRWRDEVVVPKPGDYFGRPYLSLPGQIAPGRSLALHLEYDVPAAATLGDGELVYRLDVDNHPTVRPEELSVTVHWPDGYAAADLPEGWVTTGSGAARFAAPALAGSERWRLTARAAGP